MLVYCPKCQVRIRIGADQDPDERLTCPACGAAFRAPAQRQEEDEDEQETRRPAKSARSEKASTRKRRRRDDDDEHDDKPVYWTPGRILATIAAGAVALGAVITVVILATQGGSSKSEGTVAKSNTPDQPVAPIGLP